MKFVALYKDPKKRWLQRVEFALLVMLLPFALAWGGQAATTWTKFRQAEKLHYQAEILIHEGKDLQASLAMLKESVTLCPEFLPAWHTLALNLHLAGNHDEEVATLKQAASVFPDDHMVHRDLATAYHEVGNHALELEHLEIASRLTVIDEIFLASLLKRARAEAAGSQPKAFKG